MVAASALAAACGGAAVPTPVPSPSPSPTPVPLPVIAMAGDIACAPNPPRGELCRDADTAAVVERIGAGLVLALGDEQYESGDLLDFLSVYDRTWGRFKSITRPTPGNHEYLTREAKGYFDYFNGPASATGPAGDRGKGYYSYDFGGWHFVALNSNCTAVGGGCAAGSPQEQWLRADLRASTARCTLAYMHHPRFSSGPNGSTPVLAALWQALYDLGADVVLGGHDHHYERFSAQRPDGVSDPDRGLAEFVVGTGGRSIYPFVTQLPNSEVRDATSLGALAMKLGPTGYEWQFFPAAGFTFTTERGTASCH